MQTGYRQQGVALITAMVITAIAVTVAAMLVYRQQVAIRLSGNMGALEQAYQYATGMEQWAGIILTNDRQDNDTDSKEDTWAMLLPPIPIPGGQMNGQMFDLQSRFNLNDIVVRIDKDGEVIHQPDEVQIEHLKRLFSRQGLLNAEPLLDALTDWVDKDDQESINGAESGYYKNLPDAYLAANSELVSLSELRLIKGFNETQIKDDGTEDTIYNMIKDKVIALPANLMKVNVNTADEDVLYALGLDETQVANVINDRDEEPFDSVNDFLNSLGLQNPNEFPSDKLDVRSNFFLLQGRVEIGKVRVNLNSVIYRDNSGRTRVLSREFLN